MEEKTDKEENGFGRKAFLSFIHFVLPNSWHQLRKLILQCHSADNIPSTCSLEAEWSQPGRASHCSCPPTTASDTFLPDPEGLSLTDFIKAHFFFFTLSMK